MRRSTRYSRPGLSGSSKSATLLGADGDGSTLTLDFTTGVLDSRLTFTRASNATFINSSGLVQFAAANEFRNTGWVTSTTPTGWNVTFGTGTTTWNNDGTLTMNTGGSSTRPCINANSFTVSQGIPYTFGYRVVSASGSPSIQLVISSTVAGETFAINGTTVSGSTVVQSGDVVSCTFTPTTTSAIPRMGPGVAVGMTNTAMTITQPQMNPGVTLQAYRANSSTAAANNDSARFDHDPTTLALNGLLIEGTATNLIRFSQAPESWSGAFGGVTLTQDAATAPDGVALSADQFNMTSSGFRYQITQTNQNAGTYTASIWVRAVSGTATVGFRINDTVTGANQAITNETVGTTWKRISVTFAKTNSGTQIDCGLDQRSIVSGPGVAANVFVWGLQLETGSIASSHIVTGASTVTRNADTAIIAAGTNFTSWYQGGTQGTFYADWFGGVRAGASGSTSRTVLSTDDVSTKHLHMLQTAAAGNLRVADSGGANSVTTANTMTSGARTKGAFSYNGSTANVCLNGGTVATGSSLAFSVTPTWLVIGGVSTNGTSITDANVLLNNSVRVIKYWPYPLPNATLQGLTT